MTPLPHHHALDIGAFSRLFKNTTNSYKFLFFFALLEALHQRATNNALDDATYSLRAMIVGMLRFSWYPHRYFQLSFGAQDQVAKTLSRFQYPLNENAITHPDTAARLAAAIEAQFEAIGAARLGRYVPYRLLSPFLEQQLRGQPDNRRNCLIVELARENFGANEFAHADILHVAEERPVYGSASAASHLPVLYCFTEDEQSIVLHAEWQRYLLKNYSIVKGWALYEWAHFLQKRNPNSPSILNKIEPPITRQPLTLPTDYWRGVMEHAPVYCIYSGALLNDQRFEVDHFIPWSFICHDEIWNLIPASPEANSSKGRGLPTAQHVDLFVESHINALRIQKNRANKTHWRRIARHYIEGLSLEEEALLEPELVRQAYQNKLNPLLSLARNLGFSVM